MVFGYNHRMPIAFIGGIAGSGLELLRELMNQHDRSSPDQIRCSAETEMLTAIIEKKIEWLNIRMEKTRLEHAGIDEELVDAALAQFVLQVLLRHTNVNAHSAPLLCNKDIYVFKWTDYLKRLFPNAKFVLVMRDPRAAVTSLIERQFQYENIRLNSYQNALVDWNKVRAISLNCFIFNLKF